jgi:4-amino-4-deoxy-L-arabinose transferase-like glycosyltransferase
VQPPVGRLPLALRITSLLPSLLYSTSVLSSKELKPVIEEPTVPVTPLPFLFKRTKTLVAGPTIPLPALPAISKAPQPLVEEKHLSPAIRLPQMPKLSGGLLSAAHAILPPPSYDSTIKLSIPKQRYNSILRWELLLILAVLLIAALAHGFNMFHYPYFEDDEGTYMSQAWAVVHEGQLAYYTYGYDHAPLGWIQIAGWTVITGGFHIFGPAINSGRVLMLLMQVGSTFILYCIARSLSRSVVVAVIVSLLFALSPYGIYFHRRVLLDNITTFWMLLSILLLVSGRLSLKRVWLSAAALSISILSKEPTIFLVPILAYLVFYRADRSHRWFATIGWVALVSSTVSLYVLMAILKGELFPTGTLLGGTAPHVSLLGTLQFQASRGKDGGLLDFHSGFWQLTKVWARDDPMLVIGGSLCAIFSVLVMKTQRLIGVMGLTTLSLYAFLGRGGEIIGFYLVPLLPLLALNVGLVLGLAVKRLKSFLVGPSGITIACIVELMAVGLCLFSLLAGYTSPDLGFKSNAFILWNASQADAQNQATQWVEKNLPLSSHMIIDESMWTDLYDSGYTSAHYYWKVQDDPAVRDKVFHNDWRNVDYVVTTIQMLTDAQQGQMTLVEEAIVHSTPIAHFDTGGWPVEIRKVNK